MRGLDAYQRAPRAAPPPAPPTIATVGGARLLDYGGTGPTVLFVPSLINPAAILDLTEDRSLLRWLARQGLRVQLVEWGSPDDPALDLGRHLTERLVPLMKAAGERPMLVGYCLGGTLALAAAALRPVAGVALIAAPWHFSRYDPAARDGIAALWAVASPAADRLGLLPMEVLQSGFWRLDPRRTIEKYARFASLPPGSEEAAAFVAVEDWTNAGAPVTTAAARELFEDCFARDLPGRGAWRVGGVVADPAWLQVPGLDIVSTGDRIVPAASAAGLPHRLDLALGHVGMIVGSRARSALWEPLACWLANPQVAPQA